MLGRPLLPRPLLALAGLCGCDYLVWSLSSDHGVQPLALVSGFALPLLLLALGWVLLTALGRALGEVVRRRAAILKAHPAARAKPGARGRHRRLKRRPAPGSPAHARAASARRAVAPRAQPADDPRASRPADKVAA